MAREGAEQAPAQVLISSCKMWVGVSQRLERERLKHGREQQLAHIEELKNVTRAKYF